MVSTSSQRGLSIPTNLGDTNVWGPELNATIGALDLILGGQCTLPSSTFGASVTLSSSQAECGMIIATGTPSVDFNITFSSTAFAVGNYVVQNQFTSSYNVICNSTAGPTVIVPQGQVQGITVWGNAVTSWSDGGAF